MARIIQPTPAKKDFFHRYCTLYQCKPEHFEKNVLSRCLFPPVRPLAPVIRLLDRDFFKPDMDMIAETKEATRLSQIRAIINFYSVQAEEKEFSRRQLKMRISRGKLLKLASQVFNEAP